MSTFPLHRQQQQAIWQHIASQSPKNVTAHPQLLIQRGLGLVQTGTNRDTQAENNERETTEQSAIEKAKFIAQFVCQQKASAGYQAAYDRWKKHTQDKTRFAAQAYQTIDRLFIGLGTQGALEAGVATQHTWGMPYIAGSAIKGCVRTYARQLGVPESYASVLFGNDSPDKGKPQALAAGCLAWHDAWWIPDNDSPFVAEIITPHHNAYYSGAEDHPEATDFDSPIPCPQIAVRGSFRFLIEGPMDWTRLALELLHATLTNQGLGARQAAGYGRFSKVEEVERKQTWQQASIAYTRNNQRLTATSQGKSAQIIGKEKVEALLKEISAESQERLLNKGKTLKLDAEIEIEGNGYKIIRLCPPKSSQT